MVTMITGTFKFLPLKWTPNCCKMLHGRKMLRDKEANVNSMYML
jgi:hypothetical protein